ncbi:gliding motility lipoprotein GldD [Abyssalbus ytuae]|uniref:Gliding motility lipoprotein GldD n=1 Tax=Abyssalbus ytuae TaxID=2926907 RepID=A0A9E6ZIM5_9FLAO|nr:gliding motility lipoprotein GldD [Abyssalbus ytuae]UOB16229.1 gliding motility lipoprotein GldD [Abyssalbus ytuae]
MKLKVLSIFSLFIFLSCTNPVPRPKALLRLEYPVGNYEKFAPPCPYEFKKNKTARVINKSDCSFNIEYKGMKASIFITHKKIDENNLDELLRDAQKLTYEHVIKADNIVEQPFVNKDDNVYGMFYKVSGNAASQTQFYLTDSINNFVTGSLYFYVKPNYDSILPAAHYLEKDIRKIMETFKWKKM